MIGLQFTDKSSVVQIFSSDFRAVLCDVYNDLDTRVNEGSITDVSLFRNTVNEPLNTTKVKIVLFSPHDLFSLSSLQRLATRKQGYLVMMFMYITFSIDVPVSF